MKHEYKSPYSITEVATLIRISVLEKVNLKELITEQDPLPSHNQYVKERSLFDDI